MTSLSDTSGTAKFNYDSMGRVNRTDKVIDSVTYTTQNTYDLLGRSLTVTYPDATVISYSYNGPLLLKVYDLSIIYVQYSGYNAFGQPAAIAYGNGVSTNYTYSNPGNSTCPAQNFRICSLQTISSTGMQYQNLVYAYTSKGNISAVTDSINGNQSYSYDDLDRLVNASGPYGTITYAYNQIGNMICNSQISSCSASAPNYFYPASGLGSSLPHAVVRAGATTYGYDLNGNITTRGTDTLSYNAENHMVSDVNANGTTTFVYDGNGGRVKKIVNGITTTYIGKLYECSGTNCVKYIFAGSRRIAIKPGSGGDVYYYHKDQLGSTSVMTSTTPAPSLVESTTYLPYGQIRSDTGSISTSYKFTGQYLDSDTGLYYYGARYYDATLGRFVQADTFSNFSPQSLNRYSYATNDPVNFVDPTGLRHEAFILQLFNMADKSLRKAIRNLNKRITEHEEKLGEACQLKARKHHEIELKTFKEQLNLANEEATRRGLLSIGATGFAEEIGQQETENNGNSWLDWLDPFWIQGDAY